MLAACSRTPALRSLRIPCARSRSTRAGTASKSPKTFVVVEMLKNEPGALGQAIGTFEKHGVNMTHIESRLKSFARDGPSFHIDFEGNHDDPNISAMLQELRQQCASVTVEEPQACPWFPVNIRDLDETRDTLDGGTDLIADDHPGFADEAYKNRRVEIVNLAKKYTHGQPLPVVDYTLEETQTWGAVYTRLKQQSQTMACDEYLASMNSFEKYVEFGPDKIPQIRDISDFLQQETGFQLRPIAGLLSARDFLNALAFRVFFSTQYIRHHGNPFYTPEPDICHELIGHVPMFADPDFADFSQQIGLASLGARDDEIDQLATCYWFTVEFGVMKQAGELKAYGAGLLSSFGEMEWSTQPNPSEECRQMGGIAKNFPDLYKPEMLPFDPFVVSKTPFPITTYQPKYFYVDSMADAKFKLDTFCDGLHRPFHPQNDPVTQSIVVSRAVKREPRTSTLGLQADKQREFFENLQQGLSDAQIYDSAPRLTM
eukprot:TRINITY_DN1356_c0_g1_i4.p1 TRINITY_DN1356_c0_g1~~TRINITY_DN1356_c0_g1_i4.p1  ORF type:complete len:486 (-),score=91.47 TRINITY_DN1356_c0_g1_i4:483-1940(-)